MMLTAQLLEVDPNDQDEIRGVLQHIFDTNLPQPVAAKKLQNAMYDKGHCYKMALEMLTYEQLLACGALPGEASMILRVISEPVVQQLQQLQMQPPQPQQQHSLRRCGQRVCVRSQR